MLEMMLNGMARGKETLSSQVPSPCSSQETEPPGILSEAHRIGWAKPLLIPVPFVLCPRSVILWLGDLNYRIEDPDVEKVKKLIEEKAFQTLYAYDQVPAATQALFRQLSLPCPTPQGAQKAWLPSSSSASSSSSWEGSLRSWRPPSLPSLHLCSLSYSCLPHWSCP